MPFSDSLEVGIGLSFIFFLSSLVLASIHELIEVVAKARGQYLFNGIIELLDDPNLVFGPARSGEAFTKIIYHHPVIRGLMHGDVSQPGFIRKLPSYIPTRNFAVALLDQAAQGKLTDPSSNGQAPTAATPIQQLRLIAEGIPNEQVRTPLIHAIDSAGGDMDAAQEHIEHWFDSAMDRVSGWYKRRSQKIIFFLGLVMAVLLNVNTIVIAQALSTSAQLRQAVVSEAATQELAAAPQQENCDADPKCTILPSGAVEELDRTNLPLGWTSNAIAELNALKDAKSFWRQFFGWVEIVAGYLLTAFAVTLGAPFWFDVLNRLMVIRATVKPTEKSPDEASQDPQPAAAAPVVKVLPPPPQNDNTKLAPAAPIDTAIYRVIPQTTQRLFESDLGKAVFGIAANIGEAS
jgi:hypothetical protein